MPLTKYQTNSIIAISVAVALWYIIIWPVFSIFYCPNIKYDIYLQDDKTKYKTHFVIVLYHLHNISNSAKLPITIKVDGSFYEISRTESALIVHSLPSRRQLDYISLASDNRTHYILTFLPNNYYGRSVQYYDE